MPEMQCEAAVHGTNLVGVISTLAFMDTWLHLVQWRGSWTAQSCRRCTKCNRTLIKNQLQLCEGDNY